MSKKRALILLGILIIVLGFSGLGYAIYHYANLPERINDMETIVLGQSSYVPGSQAALRVVVRNMQDQEPLPDTRVEVALQPQDGGRKVPLFEGITDTTGSVDVSFLVPEEIDPAQTLIIQSISDLGKDELEQPISIDRDYKILISTDKPLYQPGQVIHLRALALSTFDLVPASGAAIEFIIADGKGNKVFRQTLETSSFGVASVDFQLASEVNTGPYKITVQMDNTSSEKTITVERYVLPKFELTWSTDQSFYMPGEHVEGILSAQYFFGKNVAGGDVHLEGFTFDFEHQDVFSIDGVTDAEGNFKFDFDLPDYIVASDLDSGIGRFYLEASITDLARHTQQSSFSLPVAQSQIVIEAIPESGVIRPGVENILYILTSYPDGTPASTQLALRFDNQQSISIETGAYGLAEVRFVPQSAWLEVTITARDSMGSSAHESFYFEGSWEEETVLLRPDQAVYQVGQTMHLKILTSAQSGRAYLDIVREGQTVSTRTVTISDGLGEVAVDLSPDLFGTLELHAYKILRWGAIVRDTRIVVVDAPSDLSLSITPDQGEYLPGQTANIDFQVDGGNGEGVQSVLGLAIVDEAVFALAQQDPGFAKLYFMLEAELLQPKYDIHGFSVPDMLGIAPQEPDLQTALEGAAKASMASAATTSSPFSLYLDSHAVKVENARVRQAGFFSGVTNFLFGIVLMIPVVIAALAVVALTRQRVLSTSLALLFGLLLGLALLFFLIPSPDWVGNHPIDRLAYALESLSYVAGETALFAFLAGILGFLGLAVYSIRKRDWTLGVAQILTIVFVPLLVLLAFSGSLSDISPDDSVLIWALIAFLMLPLSYFLRATGFAVRRQFGWAIIAFAVFPLVLIGPIALTAFGGSAVLTNGGGMMRGDVINALPMVGAADFGIEVEVMEEKAAEPAPSQEASATGEPPRLRQYFPETMYWEPEAITDANGHVVLEIPMADSITTWRLTALASTQDGRLGATTTGIRVFQDFFIDLDLPLALTQGDEISLPVGIFNYMPESQHIQLVLEQADWFELLDEDEKEVTIAGNDIDVAYFRIKAKDFGRKAVKVTAYGSRMSDAIQKEVTVYPNGKQIHFSWSDRIPDEGVHQTVDLPDITIPGTQKLLVKIYPGVVSQVVEGLDSILRMPFGCFEQTSSTTYPNVLVLDYLEITGQASPEVQFKAEEYINLGYQRLTTFEVSGGGFSLFGDAPADRMLTAYGLQEFSDMSRVYNIDGDIIDRAAEWLLGQQSSDGSWENDMGLVHESSWSNLQNDHLPVTAYVVWSLIDAGYHDDTRTQSGLDYIKEQFSQANDPYVVALVANALVADDRENNHTSSFTEKVLGQLAGTVKYNGESAFWTSEVATFMGGEGQTGSIETTALAAYAFLRADSHPEISNAALTYLIRQKDSFGTWYSTQATVLSLKALIETVRSGAENVDASVTVKLNDGQTHTISVTPANFDVVQLVSFDDINPSRENIVSIAVEGEGNLMYQISGSYYLPWDDFLREQDLVDEPQLVTIDVEYDRRELKVDDTVQVDVNVTLNKAGRAEWVLVDLGIPPGFQVKAEDLTALVNRFEDVPEDYTYPTVERYELTGRQILVYVGNLTYEHPLEFSYRLLAKFPLVAQTPASNAYDYYNPDVRGEQVPIELVVVAED